MMRLLQIQILLLLVFPAFTSGQGISLKNNRLDLQWTKDASGFKLSRLAVSSPQGWQGISNANGAYTLLYSQAKPDVTPEKLLDEKGQEIIFPEAHYRYLIPVWKQSISPVELNTAGEAIQFFPSSAVQTANEILFTQENEKAFITSLWSFDPAFANDVKVEIRIIAKQAGHFSMASPSLASLNKNHFKWATVPGVFQGNAIEKKFINAFAYGQGIPERPVVVRERTASTLAPMVTTSGNITLAVIPEPGTGRDPWAKNEKTNSDWLIGLSVMNRNAELMPTLYHPVLGEKKSWLNAGDSIVFRFRYSIQPENWYPVFKHAVNDVYQFNHFLHLKRTRQSLTNRLLGMHRYLVNDSLSLWRLDDFKGMTIGAQDYLGGVYGSDKDAMKNADYGAMWMLGKITEDGTLLTTRLPYARNFKLMQQHTDTGFFHGAAAGQYYLHKSNQFTEEWGDYSEPVGSTFYMLCDIGNVLLFEKNDTALRTALRISADKLLQWMGPNGQWQVAYDNKTQQPLFTDVQDLRPTFYGMIVAYQVLKDPKYLAAAKLGADWYITNAVERGRFLGTCGDARFVPDFATGQSAQALLDLYDITKEEKYKKAAIDVATIYTASVYTHPVPTTQQKTVNGITREDWEISQVGLSFEHGGVIGSANHRGPIMLASHAGMFVRLFSLTKDSLFLNMARAAALGRDAFVDSATSVASYYWDVMNKGAGPYPHHAWWQIGWITDYLLSEVRMRSNGKVEFPRGFITPKVGPHQTYGFADGKIYGSNASLLLKEGMLTIADPYTDYFTAIDTKGKKLFLLVMNNDDEARKVNIALDPAKVIKGKKIKLVKTIVQSDKHATPLNNSGKWSISLPPYGLKVIAITYR
ncbi:glycerophosphoryl diester phosphodiesterase [Pseudobacter ginsenosidimutans]|nr:glycerophosphoryl diester phosphodiesterase [Pseudobacter ginsenosidimutans]